MDAEHEPGVCQRLSHRQRGCSDFLPAIRRNERERHRAAQLQLNGAAFRDGILQRVRNTVDENAVIHARRNASLRQDHQWHALAGMNIDRALTIKDHDGFANRLARG